MPSREVAAFSVFFFSLRPLSSVESAQKVDALFCRTRGKTDFIAQFLSKRCNYPKPVRSCFLCGPRWFHHLLNFANHPQWRSQNVFSSPQPSLPSCFGRRREKGIIMNGRPRQACFMPYGIVLVKITGWHTTWYVTRYQVYTTMREVWRVLSCRPASSFNSLTAIIGSTKRKEGK